MIITKPFINDEIIFGFFLITGCWLIVQLLLLATLGPNSGCNNHKKILRTCLDTLTFDLILVKLDQKQEFLIHEKLCTPL